MISNRLYRRYYPDDSLSGTLAFYRWVREHTRPETALLNLGAGPPTRSLVRSFKGEVALVAGADIDPVVEKNDELDQARVMRDGLIPYPDQHFDLVLSDFVIEHVEKPRQLLSEVRRVLKPTGGFFFRTPNKLHYVALAARLTPHWVHEAIANPVRGLSARHGNPHRTFYRLNSGKAIERLARTTGFSKVELRFYEAEPSYMLFNQLAFLIGVAYERLVNRFEPLAPLRANIFGRLVR